MEALRWGIIGFGEAGSAFAKHISRHLNRPVRVTDPLLNRSPLPHQIQKRLAGTSIEVAPDILSLVAKSDVAISLVTARVASAVAARAGSTFRRGLYIDFNSVSPTEKERMAVRFPRGTYVDGAILGSIAREGATTNLVLAGLRAGRASKLLREVGLRVSVAGSQVGAASALKMCRSVFMKGIECLLLETLIAAGEFKVTEPVLRSIEQTFNSYGLRQMVRMLVTTHAAHCGRRADEMRSAAKMLDAIGLPGHMTKAARDFLAASHRVGLTDHFKGLVPDNFEVVISYLKKAYRGLP